MEPKEREEFIISRCVCEVDDVLMDWEILGEEVRSWRQHMDSVWFMYFCCCFKRMFDFFDLKSRRFFGGVVLIVDI